MSGAEGHVRGEIPLPRGPELRLAAACAIAGVLAEHSVPSLDVADPRACRRWTLKAREADLPRVIVDAAPGTTLESPDVFIMVDEERVQFSAAPAIGASLSPLSRG